YIGVLGLDFHVFFSVDYMVYHGKWVSCFMRERDGGKKDSNRLRAKKIGDERADIGKHMSGDSSQTVNVPINSLGPVSFATLFKGEPSRKTVNFCTSLAPTGNGVDVAISSDSVRVVRA
ncbi:hypothetical protein Tco_0847390, partial [Tanacetum coccineum]